MTVDETWIQWFTLKNTEQSKQWTEQAKLRRRRPGLSYWPESCWPPFSGIHKVCFESKTLTGLCNAKFLDQFDSAFWKNQLHLVKQKVLFRYDNIPADTSAVINIKPVILAYELLFHTPYSTLKTSRGQIFTLCVMSWHIVESNVLV